jgi:hypothetical protein
MSAKDFFRNKRVLWGIFVIILILIAIGIELAISISKTKETIKWIQTEAKNQIVPALDWDDSNIRETFKRKLWMENLLLLSKNDSMSLGISLNDSIMQVQIKGLPLIKSKIVHINPENFLSKIDEQDYAFLFGKPTLIKEGIANFTKRPIRKMKVIAGSDAQPIDTDTVEVKRFYWEFITENKIRIVINGCSLPSDSLHNKPSFMMDRARFTLSKNMADSLNYLPTLFLWMPDNEAKAIYRALPEKINVAIRN